MALCNRLSSSELDHHHHHHHLTVSSQKALPPNSKKHENDWNKQHQSNSDSEEDKDKSDPDQKRRRWRTAGGTQSSDEAGDGVPGRVLLRGHPGALLDLPASPSVTTCWFFLSLLFLCHSTKIQDRALCIFRSV